MRITDVGHPIIIRDVFSLCLMLMKPWKFARSIHSAKLLFWPTKQHGQVMHATHLKLLMTCSPNDENIWKLHWNAFCRNWKCFYFIYTLSLPPRNQEVMTRQCMESMVFTIEEILEYHVTWQYQFQVCSQKLHHIILFCQSLPPKYSHCCWGQGY